MQSIHASMLRPYQDGKPDSSAKASWKDASRRSSHRRSGSSCRQSRWRRPRHHALGPDRVDTLFGSCHHMPISRIQATDCNDHQYAPSGTRSRTNAIPAVDIAKPGEWPVLRARAGISRSSWASRRPPGKARGARRRERADTPSPCARLPSGLARVKDLSDCLIDPFPPLRHGYLPGRYQRVHRHLAAQHHESV